MAAADCIARQARDDRTIARALRILEKRVRYESQNRPLNSPDAVRNYLRLRLDGLDREEFWCVWLDALNVPLDAECMFVGTLTQTSVYPREIVRRALHYNAASVIFAHNHPSGATEPSSADMDLTAKLRDVLSLVDVRVLDHFIVGRAVRPMSFLERGLI